jgi:hypothetical protein
VDCKTGTCGNDVARSIHDVGGPCIVGGSDSGLGTGRIEEDGTRTQRIVGIMTGWEWCWTTFWSLEAASTVDAPVAIPLELFRQAVSVQSARNSSTKALEDKGRLSWGQAVEFKEQCPITWVGSVLHSREAPLLPT